MVKRIRTTGSGLQLDRTTLRKLSFNELSNVAGGGKQSEGGQNCSNSCQLVPPDPDLVGGDEADLQKNVCTKICVPV